MEGIDIDIDEKEKGKEKESDNVHLVTLMKICSALPMNETHWMQCRN